MTYLTGYTYSTNDAAHKIEFYDIDEWSLGKYCSPIRLSETTSKEIIFENVNIAFLTDLFNPTIYFAESNRYPILLLKRISQPVPNVWDSPTIIIDLKHRRYISLNESLKLKNSILNPKDDISSQVMSIDLAENVEQLNWQPLIKLK